MCGLSTGKMKISDKKPDFSGKIIFLVKNVVKNVAKNVAKNVVGNVVGNVVKNALFPPKCVICKNLYHYEHCNFTGKASENLSFEDIMAEILCPECVKDFFPVEPPFCIKCGLMFKTGAGENHLCGDCIKSQPSFLMARACGAHDGSLKKAIHCFKYHEKIHLARPLGLLLFSAFLRYFKDKSIDYILPVPLHIKRMRQRGFNQAWLLIKKWPLFAQSAGLDFSRHKTAKNLIIRKKYTTPQTGMSKKERRQNIKGAFHVPFPGKIKGKNILIADDVFTTGATVEECAKILLKSGAKGIYILTLSRAGKAVIKNH